MKKLYLAALAVLLAHPAVAQFADVAVTRPAIDLTPVVNGVIVLLGSVLTVVVPWVATRIAKHYNLKIDADQQAAFDVMLKKVIAFGGASATELVKQHGWSSIIVKNAVLNTAAQAAVDKFPSTLKGVGLDPAAPDFADHLADALNRAFPEAIAPVVNSPVTPPATVETTPAPVVTPPA